MKNLIIILSVVLIVMSSFLASHRFNPALPAGRQVATGSGIRGTIEPAEGAKKVWAISGSDSVSTLPLMGKFSIDLKAGNWKLIVEAVQPYRNTSVESLLVVDGEYTDAGVIRLPN